MVARTAAVAVLLALVAAAPAAAAIPTAPDPGTVGFAGQMGSTSAAARIAGGTWVGGSFGAVGEPVDQAVLVDPATGDVTKNLGIRGFVRAVADDGAGGAYLGGSFTEVGATPRAFLAHIDADGNVSSRPLPVPNSTVTALAVSEDGTTVIVGGSFSKVNDLDRSRFAVFEAATGQVLPPRLAFSEGFQEPIQIQALEIDGGTVYLGGAFVDVDKFGAADDGITHAYLAAITITSGDVQAWEPDPDSAVNALHRNATTDTLYAGGVFNTVGGAAHNHMVAFLPNLATSATFTPNVASGNVQTIETNAAGTEVWIGGSFATVNGETVRAFARLTATGAVSLNAGIQGEGVFQTRVQALARVGDTIVAGGEFVRVLGVGRIGVASITGSGLDDFNPGLYAGASVIASIGTKYLIGGTISIARGERRTALARLDLDGRALAPAPSLASNTFPPISTLVAPASGPLFVGGMFSALADAPRANLGAIDPVSGLPTGFDPEPNQSIATAAIAPDGTRLYVGGFFTQIAGQPRNGLAAFDLPAGRLSDWAPMTAAGSVVTKLVASPDSQTIYFGGSFTKAGTDAADRKNMAAVRADTGAATAFRPEPNTFVQGLLFDGGRNKIYTAGQFSKIGAQTPQPSREHFAALDPATGDAVDPVVDVAGAVQALALTEDGRNLAIGGTLSTIGGQPRGFAGDIDLTTGQVGSWDPQLNGTVRELVFSEGSLIALGNFTYVGTHPVANYAQFTLPPENRASPAIGAEFKCSTGTWFNTPRSFTHEWLIDGQPVAGQTGDTFGAVAANPGRALTCKVTASNGGGSASATSAAVTLPTPAPTPTPTPIPLPDLAPVLSEVSVSNKRFRLAAGRTSPTGVAAAAKRGTRFRFRLSEDATVTIAINRVRGGFRRGTKCVAKRPRGARRRCDLAVGSLRRTAKAGRRQVTFTGRIGRKALKPGSYVARLTAVDAGRKASRTVAVRFTIVRR